jgi:hypothetical protein
VLDHDPTLTATRRGLTIIADKGYASAELDRYLAERGATLLRPTTTAPGRADPDRDARYRESPSALPVVGANSARGGPLTPTTVRLLVMARYQASCMSQSMACGQASSTEMCPSSARSHSSD